MKKSDLSIEKTFQTDVEALYKAWTEEDALKAWWKPGGRTLQSVEAEVKVDGNIKYTFKEVDESSLVVEGVYETVDPQEKLVYTWNWIMENTPVENGSHTLAVKFDSTDEGSKITIHQTGENKEEGIHPNQEGWEESLEALNTYLSS